MTLSQLREFVIGLVPEQAVSMKGEVRQFMALPLEQRTAEKFQELMRFLPPPES